MSKRRKQGDIIWKVPNAGFCGKPGFGIIPDNSLPDVSLFCECGDKECQEWDVYPIDDAGNPTGGIWCHVCECEMLDEPPVSFEDLCVALAAALRAGDPRRIIDAQNAIRDAVEALDV